MSEFGVRKKYSENEMLLRGVYPHCSDSSFMSAAFFIYFARSPLFHAAFALVSVHELSLLLHVWMY
jgi:hypothetical protein